MSADIHALAGAYALHALDPDEERMFRRHVEACPSCMEEVHGFRRTAALLGEAAEERPPATLRQAVLTAVDETPQARPLVPAAAGWRFRVAPVLAPMAAGLLLVLVALGSLVVYQDRELAALRAQHEERQEALQQVLAAGDTATLTLQGEGEAVVVWSPSQATAVLVATGLEELPADRAYQLWLLRDGVPLPSELFRPDREGRAVAIVRDAPQSLEGMAISVEPEEGATTPTGPIVLSSA